MIMTHAERAARRSAIAKAAAEGADLATLMERFGVCQQTVYNACRWADNPVLPRNRARVRRDAVIALALEGERPPAIAGKLSIPLSTVQRIVTDYAISCLYGESTRHKYYCPASRIPSFQVLLALLDKSPEETDTAVAKSLGCTRQRVEQIRREAEKFGLLAKPLEKEVEQLTRLLG
jgi:hypothetical protein